MRSGQVGPRGGSLRWVSWAVPLLAVLLPVARGYQSVIVTVDILPMGESDEPSAADVAQHLASVASASEYIEHPTDGHIGFDPMQKVEVAQDAQAASVEVSAEDDVRVAAGGRLETQARSLFGRFAEDVDVLADGAHLKAAHGSVAMFASGGADMHVRTLKIVMCAMLG